MVTGRALGRITGGGGLFDPSERMVHTVPWRGRCDII